MPGPAPLRAGCYQLFCEADLQCHSGECLVTLGGDRQQQRLTQRAEECSRDYVHLSGS